YYQIMNIANESREVRAFTFKRGSDLYVVYWHISGDRKLELPLNPGDITLMENIGQEISVQADQNGKNSIVPVGKRRYLKTSRLSKDDLITAFRKAKITD
ncbi:MAG TPA: hypothetical protein PKM69_06180, partial [Bacteroidales bacterium]|nr:hypothetical protein [Bacteroidales bacterium]